MDRAGRRHRLLSGAGRPGDRRGRARYRRHRRLARHHGETGDGWRLGATTTWSRAARGRPAAAVRRAEAGGARGRRPARSRMPERLREICATPRPRPMACRRCWRSTPTVELAGRAGTRRLPLAAFITGNRRTVAGAGRAAGRNPCSAGLHADARSAFLKLGARRYLVISIAMAAATLEIADGRVAAARIAVGACSAVAQRLPALEAALVGAPLDRLADRRRAVAAGAARRRSTTCAAAPAIGSMRWSRCCAACSRASRR